MLSDSLIAVKQQLQSNLQNRFGLSEEIVVLNHLVEQDGGVPQKNRNKMVVTLFNITEETVKQFVQTHIRESGTEFARYTPNIDFNLFLIFTACFDDYEESLKFLNSTISYFQSNTVIQADFSHKQETASLKFEIENASHNEMHNLWSAMGAKYRPSILYKVRYVRIKSNELKGVNTEVQATQVEART